MSTLNDTAAAWAVRLDRGLAAADQAALDAWLAEDPRHRGALLRAQAAWSVLDRASVLGAGAPVQQPRASRRTLITGAVGVLAAGIAVAALLGVNAQRYGTAVGELRRVSLADGSVAEINTQSSVDVTLTDTARNIDVRQGEAFFQVAHDTARPFIVAAGDVRVRAIGTAFAVRRRAAGADVAVTEGVVETWTVGAEDKKVRISAGARAFVDKTAGGQTPVAAPQDIERALAWRSGQIALDGSTLGQAVAEFNRYNDRKLVIADDALVGERLVGWFRTNDPQGFAQAVVATLDARIVTGDKEIRLLRK